MRIKQMPDALANKIAAGEVVERPASVVKELVENSIDANSSFIKIEVSEAGLEKIKITDNGDGMSETDCERSVLRHATSKISNENDLFHVRTLGFRGEALASIAAVSRLTVKSSTGDEAGTLLELEGGKLVRKSKSDARQGTEIMVENLFFNTPARLKYMKTIHTELGHISDVMNRMALSHPTIRFEVYHNEKQLFRSPGRGDLLQIIAQVYGINVAKKMVPVKHSTLDFSIQGYVAKPEVTRASRNYISTIVNGRFIRSIALNKAIAKGYHTLLPIGRHPLVVLDIQMDPILVDVNVHPAKLEVRFSKERELFEAIESTIREAFRKETLIPEASQPKPNRQQSVQNSFEFHEPAPYAKAKEATQLYDGQKHVEMVDNRLAETAEKASDLSMEERLKETISEVEQNDLEGSRDWNAEPVQAIEEEHETNNDRIPAMYPIGQHHGTYILAQNENGLYIIDQHAAQERIKYEFFKEKIGEVPNEVQELLMPLTFDFSRQEALLIEQYQEEFRKIGLFFEPFGEQSYAIRSHPQWFPKGFEEEVIQEIVEQVIADEKVNIKKIREEAAILMSCKRSIKANHYLNHDDMFRLLEDLRKSTDPFTCPHGRPIIAHFSPYEMEKMFKRVM
ncbi:DNA mismatch repair endonuclease MutL [Sediminibacillus halophilus]|uniref:DNA mismatch repair protein MutL n=1 Tax=Sediminibacillus halophilus TaxID=482461 RepID=A0A1G9MBZ2_9BACI|nr:DNA mismatch repair endonuclease MutL [Sediminibacillus halophilus]SDL71729.1 DNA mismatch repair protein MutL [Sediminibacillus halophilus]